MNRRAAWTLPTCRARLSTWKDHPVFSTSHLSIALEGEIRAKLPCPECPEHCTTIRKVPKTIELYEQPQIAQSVVLSAPVDRRALPIAPKAICAVGFSETASRNSPIAARLSSARRPLLIRSKSCSTPLQVRRAKSKAIGRGYFMQQAT